MELLRDMMRQWYFVLSQMSVGLSAPVKQVADAVELPILTVLLIGLVGALSPCQLTTNLSAMAYVSRRASTARVWSEALAYSLGKILIYTLAGGAVIILGVKLQQSAIPIVAVARKGVGPVMILIGLGLLGLIRLRGSFGRKLSSWLESCLPQKGLIGAFGLGVVFSFTFCATLFWLFFGLMIPLALISAGWLDFSSTLCRWDCSSSAGFRWASECGDRNEQHMDRAFKALATPHNSNFRSDLCPFRN